MGHKAHRQPGLRHCRLHLSTRLCGNSLLYSGLLLLLRGSRSGYLGTHALVHPVLYVAPRLARIYCFWQAVCGGIPIPVAIVAVFACGSYCVAVFACGCDRSAHAALLSLRKFLWAFGCYCYSVTASCGVMSKKQEN